MHANMLLKVPFESYEQIPLFPFFVVDAITPQFKANTSYAQTKKHLFEKSKETLF